MPEVYTTLKGPPIGQSTLSPQLKSNVITFFNWGLLGKGAFFNVSLSQAGPYGGDESRLRLVDDPNYSRGQVWESFRSDWVWETGVGFSTQPTRVSGVYVNSSFHPATGAGTYAHHVNYPEGRVIFDTAISPTSLVQTEYSYRYFQFTTVDDPWFREVQYRSFRADDSSFLLEGSGNWSQLSKSRVQMPAVAVEVFPKRSFKPYQLGGGQSVFQDIKFHIIAEHDWERGRILDEISYQNDKEIFLYNVNTIDFPLNYQGSPVSDGKMYPDFVSPTGGGGDRWKKCRFINARTERVPSANPSLFLGCVVLTAEIVMGEL